MTGQGGACLPESGKTYVPLSRGQRGLWFSYQINPESSAYNVHLAWYVRCEIDMAVFRKVLFILAVRHPTLRATYEADGEKVRQVVHETPFPIFEEIPANEWDDRDVTAELDRWIYKPFALDREPPIRWWLFRRREGDPILVLQMHHIGTDGWSIVTLLRELRDLYAAEKAGRALMLPRIELSNSDFVRHQEEMLAGEEGALHLAYWRERLGGQLPYLDLQTDFPRPPVPSVNSSLIRLDLAPQLMDDLRKLAKNLGVSSFKLFLSAYQVLLRRYTGQNDICVGVVTGGRDQRFAGIFNCFINTVAIRARFKGNPSFREFLHAHAPLVGEDLRHRDYPFSELVNRILTNRDPSRTPLIQTLFVWENFNRFEEAESPIVSMDEELNEWWELGEIRLQRLLINLTLNHFELTTKVVQVGERFYFQIEYNTDLFTRATMHGLAVNFNRLLLTIARNPEASIAALPILPKEERRTVVHEWNEMFHPGLAWT